MAAVGVKLMGVPVGGGIGRSALFAKMGAKAGVEVLFVAFCFLASTSLNFQGAATPKPASPAAPPKAGAPVVTCCWLLQLRSRLRFVVLLGFWMDWCNGVYVETCKGPVRLRPFDVH